MSLMRLLSPALFAPLALTACGTSGDDALGVSESGAADTVGLPRARPGDVVIDRGDATVPTPYGGAGAALSCASAARDIARITAVVGADVEPRARNGAEEDGDLADDTVTFASDLAEDAPGLARDAARDAIVGLNPARPVVRFLGRAGEIEAEARRERQLAMNRRAWLRGAFDNLGCERETLLDAFRAYNLLQETDR